jgi:hypothetical protein
MNAQIQGGVVAGLGQFKSHRMALAKKEQRKGRSGCLTKYVASNMEPAFSKRYGKPWREARQLIDSFLPSSELRAALPPEPSISSRASETSSRAFDRLQSFLPPLELAVACSRFVLAASGASDTSSRASDLLLQNL